MVKAKKQGGRRYQASSKGKAVDSTEVTAAAERPDTSPPNHIERRLVKRATFLKKVAASKLAAKASVDTKHKQAKQTRPLPDLSSLGEVLTQELAAAQQHQHLKQRQSRQRKGKGRTEQVSGSRARRVITQKETMHTLAVLQHPLFIADPLKAVCNHLTATAPPPVEGPKPAAQKQDKQRPPRAEWRKRRKLRRQAEQEQRKQEHLQQVRQNVSMQD